MPKPEEIAKLIARDLFIFAGDHPERAARLVMEFDRPLEGPGWSERAMADRIAEMLRACDAALARTEKADGGGEAMSEDTPKRSCNRHDDCDAAEEKYRRRTGHVGYISNFHCHDDCCEDCFGS